eukprot:scaffold625506_cov25-Prasinocladus_malaysianus.AAC.1
MPDARFKVRICLWCNARERLGIFFPCDDFLQRFPTASPPSTVLLLRPHDLCCPCRCGIAELIVEPGVGFH